MKETTKTLVFVAGAVLLTGAAFLRVPDRSAQDIAFVDAGQPFFPEFKDPFACTDLQVVDYEPSTATASEFEVKFKDGKWVIPSHYDYPADAKDRLAKTASSVMDLNKDTIRSDRVEDQEEMGVVDPLDAKVTSLKGRGKRVTLRDASEKVLADLIIGNEVRKEKDSPGGEPAKGQRYVRVPGQKRIYGVNVKADLSTKFADWIETNLLKLDASKVRKVVIDHHKVDPERRAIVPGDVLTLERKDANGPWTTEGVPEGKELDAEKLTAMTTALSDLKIVGVRPKPDGLSRELKVATGGEVKPTTQQGLSSLVTKGFYPTAKGLYSNQGDVIVSTEEGVVYTLRYGEVVIASGLDLTAGTDESAAAKDNAKKPQGAAENRYLMVTVSFDPSLIPQPAPVEEPKGPLTLPEDPFQKAPDDPKRIAEEKEAKDKADREKADQERKIADGQKRANELTERFAGWYYVTPGESFKSISLDRANLIQDPKPKAPASGGMPPGMGGFPHQGIPGFPGQ
ncbi:protein of unknown function [Singulisphaera sp. GP187]|uniref:DUF4340 domain-containing protein n=1 Tax=Singulisphaera sp. GP187 TaxID=1882752 RepID=UPI000927E4A8|nr:DUF4340 domain-containing protein [Singulisphaera sp. GP187]SIN78689.1 protein of unknown function [Singulisphaera sp. GP187]